MPDKSIGPVMPPGGAFPELKPTFPIDRSKLVKAAQDFEAMAVSQLLQPMFDTIKPLARGFGGGPGEEAWKPMLVQEFGKQIAKHGGLGLAKPVYDAMTRMQETKAK